MQPSEFGRNVFSDPGEHQDPRGQPRQTADVICGYRKGSDDLLTYEGMWPAGKSGSHCKTSETVTGLMWKSAAHSYGLLCCGFCFACWTVKIWLKCEIESRRTPDLNQNPSN